MKASILFCMIALVLVLTACTPSKTPPSLPNFTIVDLTQPMTPNLPIWPGDPKFKIRPWATYETDQYFINHISIGEHSGTHWGTPNTFIKGARSADMFEAKELVLPAVLMDIRKQIQGDKDYRLSIQDVKEWEKAQGKTIPPGSFVIIFTGWQYKWHLPDSFLGTDPNHVLHWPGFDAKTAAFLMEERRVAGLGTDTHGTDPGNDEEFGASFAVYKNDGMILECLSGLDKLPPFGATLIIGGWPIQGGSGSPARVMALLPQWP
ncbi:MAG: cyclase family protein [Desulfovibrionales bacterium]|nr:cyclase family protein [Desulfovibrionales bacterium]